MEAEFDDFLKYLDFGSGSVVNHHGPAAGSRDDSGLSSISSDKSTSASPQDKIFSDFGGSSHSNSPQAAQLSFPGGPAPSLVFNDGFNSSFDGSNSSGASWGAISNQSNSPPFDASIYGSPVLQQQPQLQQQHRGSFDFNAFGNINLQGYTQPNPQSELSPQLQLLLLQQAQLNMQTQPQHQNYQQPMQYQHQQPQPLQQQQQPMFQQQPYEQQYQQLLQQHAQQQQYQAAPSLSQPQAAEQQARRMSVQHAGAHNLAASQSYPSSHAAMNGPAAQKIALQPIQAKAAEPHLSLLPSGTTQPLAPNMKKATLKRSYQQVKSEEDAQDQELSVDLSQFLQRSTSQASETVSGEDAEPKSGNRGGHNAVEQKYRRGINDSLIMLREIVPALGHLRAAPGAAPSKRKASQFSLAAAATPAAPSQLVDGVIPPKKLSKQLILVTATDYIRYLASRREELEGELNTLRQTLDECLEDSKLVFDLAESKFAPERARILTRREEIYTDRTSAKESSKKRKVDGDSSGKKGPRNAKDGSDDDSDDSGEEDEAEQEVFAMSSALPVKTQPKARGRPKKAAPSVLTTAGQPVTQQQGPPKALLSIFGGISFIGGAGYDLLYGASSGAVASQPDTVNPARVWSHGLVRRSPAAVLPSHEDHLNSMQKFLIGRPALLSGLITFTLGLIIAYVLFYIIPNFYNRFTKSNRLAAKARARATLRELSKLSSKQRRSERSALAILADAPQSSFAQIFYAIMLSIQAIALGSFSASTEPSDETAAIERAAASIRLLELDSSISTSSSLQRISSFLHLYVLLRLPQWPTQESANDMSAQANAVLSLAAINIFGTRGLSFASARWEIAQDQIKKHTETARPWLKSALALKHEEVVSMNVKCLSELAERQYDISLLEAWRDLFSHVMLSTNTVGTANEQTASITKTTGSSSALNDMLALLPATSRNRSLILLYRGVQAMEVNDKARVIQIAVELSKSSQKSAGVQAYLDMVTGAGFPDPPATFSTSSECLAYVTIAWLRLRAAISPSSQGPIKVNDALQASALKVRKLLADDVFDGTGSESHFVEAQERCLEGLVRIGRQAAGLYAESDSGCEM